MTDFVNTRLGVQWVAEALEAAESAVRATLHRPPTLQEINAALLARFRVSKWC